LKTALTIICGKKNDHRNDGSDEQNVLNRALCGLLSH
jgi:hypothetical protein